MAHIVSNNPVSRFNLGLGSVVGFFQNIRKAWQQQARVRATMDELNRLNHAELMDLGISRADIPRIAMDSVYDTKA